MADPGPEAPTSERARDAESVLRRLGFSRVRPQRKASADADASFWVQEPGYPRRTFPVYFPPAETTAIADRIDRWLKLSGGTSPARRRAIFVAPSDAVAEATWERLHAHSGSELNGTISILVLPKGEEADRPAHFHLRRAEPTEVLRVATGVVVGLFRRGQATESSGQIDFEEMLGTLRTTFGLDVQRSLGVESDEDALFLLYQLALKEAYAPGDGGANLHLVVLKPTGPAARLPWFAAEPGARTEGLRTPPRSIPADERRDVPDPVHPDPGELDARTRGLSGGGDPRPLGVLLARAHQHPDHRRRRHRHLAPRAVGRRRRALRDNRYLASLGPRPVRPNGAVG